MTATNAFGDFALDADLTAILGLDRGETPARSGDAPDYRYWAKLLVAVVPVLAMVVVIVGAIHFLRPQSDDRVAAGPPIPPPTASTDEPGVRPAATPAPSDLVAPLVVPATLPPDQPIAPVREARRPTGSTRTARPTPATADVARAERTRSPQPPVENGARNTVAPPPLPAEPYRPAPSDVTVADAPEPSRVEPADDRTPAERARRDNVSAIRALRRQF